MRDFDGVFRALAGSPFRRRVRLAPRDAAYLRERGLDTVLVHAREFLARRLAPAAPVNDWLAAQGAEEKR